MDIRTSVAQACNILAMEGHMDTIYGHVSARQEGTEHVLEFSKNKSHKIHGFGMIFVN